MSGHGWGIGLAMLVAGGCAGGPALVAPVIDYRAGAAVIEIQPFAEDRDERPSATQSTVYNLDHEEGRRAAEQARKQGQEPSLAYTIAHNLALRLEEADSELAAAGLSRPVVTVTVGRGPARYVATGSRMGSAFEAPPKDLPPAAVTVAGSLLKSPVAPGGWVATLRIREPSGQHAHELRFLDPDAAATVGLVKVPEDPRGQLIARLADYLGPHRLRVTPRGAPLGFVRSVGEDGAIEVDLGLERRTLHVARVLEAFDPPLPDQPGRSDLEPVVRNRYVRIQFAGGPRPPEHPVWLRLEVSEAE